MITISDKAKEKVIQIMSEENLDNSYFLRVGVKGGGCSGLSYVMDFDNQINEGDQVFEDNDIKIVCNKVSLLYLLGTELTYSGGLNGKGFEWNNPNAQRTCGCGESFSL
jgi:iron-sulfur cluster assembly protein